MANFQIVLLFIQKMSWFLTGCNISQCPPKKKKKPERKRQKNPVRVGVSVSRIGLGTFNEAYMTQKRQNGLRVLETSWETKMADESLRNWVTAFQGLFWKFSLPCRSLICSGLIQRKQKPGFHHIPCIKRL